MAHRLDGDRAQPLIFLVGQGLGRRDDDGIPGVDSHRVEVLHIADGDAVVAPVADDLVFDLLPAVQVLLDEHLRDAAVERALQRGFEVAFFANDVAALSAQRVGPPQHDRKADLLGGPLRLRDRVTRNAARRLDADLVEPLDEETPVLGVLDGLDGSAEDADAVALEHAATIEVQATVERRLTAEGQQDGIDLVRGDHALDELRNHRHQMHSVGQAVAGLNCGDVGVDEDRLDTLFPQRLDRLRARIVELAGLADPEGAGSEDQDPARLARQIGPEHDAHPRPMAPTRRTKSSNRNPVSSGPGAASGWN